MVAFYIAVFSLSFVNPSKIKFLTILDLPNLEALIIYETHPEEEYYAKFGNYYQMWFFPQTGQKSYACQNRKSKTQRTLPRVQSSS